MSVPAILAIPRVLSSVRAILTGDATLVGRLHPAPPAVGGGPGIYTEGAVPTGAETDYLSIGPFTERSESTMGDGRKWGSELSMTIKLVTESQNIGACLTTVERVVALLHGVPLTVEDYAAGSAVLNVVVDAYMELVGGRQYTHYPVIFTVRVHQPL